MSQTLTPYQPTVEMRVEVPSTPPCEFRLLLDPAQFSQGIMLETLKLGQVYEPDVSGLMENKLRPGDTVLDIGGHIGYFTCLAAAMVGPSGRVFAFEPEPRNYGHLVSHLALNKFAHVTPFHMAVGKTPGPVTFHMNRDNDGGHALWDITAHSFNQKSKANPISRDVYLTSIDALRPLIGTPRVIKIDVEGNEMGVLQGATELLHSGTVPYVILEINDTGLQTMGSSRAAVRAFMKACGYEVYFHTNGGFTRVPDHADIVTNDNSVFNLLFVHPEAAARD